MSIIQLVELASHRFFLGWAGGFEPGISRRQFSWNSAPERQAAFATVPWGSRMNFTGAPLSKSA
jgi:hypothetical protein